MVPNNIYEVEGYFYVNDLELWDHDNNPATQEHLYAALGYSFHSKMKSTYLDIFDYGLFRSTDGGTNWSQVSLNNPVTGVPEHFNDIDVQKFRIVYGLQRLTHTIVLAVEISIFQNQMETQILRLFHLHGQQRHHK